jgi:hypothetical protein
MTTTPAHRSPGGLSGSTRPSHRGLSARQPSYMHGTRLTEEQVEAMIENFAKEDDITGKTWTRRIVENFLGHVSVLPSRFYYYF